MPEADHQLRTKLLLLNTGLQPGVGGRRVSSAVSTASRTRGKAAKAARRSVGAFVTGLKPGTNEWCHFEVAEAKNVSGYKIRLTFSDGTVRVVDFAPFLWTARNPDTTDDRDSKQSSSFGLEDGDLIWGNFQVIFPILDLYEGRI
jgi:hypothetical protein